MGTLIVINLSAYIDVCRYLFQGIIRSEHQYLNGCFFFFFIKIKDVRSKRPVYYW